MPNSYEHSYQHDLDNVIDVSDAVLTIGTEKVDTNTLKDRALSNDATIHGAMPSNGYFLGRRFVAANENYLDCGNDSSLALTGNFTLSTLSKCKLSSTGYYNLIGKNIANDKVYILIHPRSSTHSFIEMRYDGVGDSDQDIPDISNIALIPYILHLFTFIRNGTTCNGYIDGNFVGTFESSDVLNGIQPITIGGVSTQYLDGIIAYSYISISPNNTVKEQSFFNKLAHLPLYSHNFERYPNSDTLLTSVFPYTSGIITSGSFNKTDGLKCTSAGQIIFSNSFKFDGSEYITLVINGVEYSGTTTVTQGTITATIVQGSNDITIDMGTNDVLEDIRIQFRSEI